MENTAKRITVEEHYDLLADEGNDPVKDPPMLANYMNGWDGDSFFELLGELDGKKVLEIGCGTGRLALRALARGCAHYTGIDISERSLELAKENLSSYENFTLLKMSFPAEYPDALFDAVFSSLTFMHIEDKLTAYRSISNLLAPNGIAVISLSKDRSEKIELPEYSVHVYPDDPDEAIGFIRAARLIPCGITETEKAYIVCAKKI